ncbi:MAG: hypothetical protein AAF770_01755 [Bacteroidota bacterium]
MQYPKQHHDIITTLLGGRFIIDHSPLFAIISKEQEFYRSFFYETYRYELQWEGTYCYLSSKETKETASRDLLLLLSVLAYEYQNDQKDFVHILLHEEIRVADIERCIKESSKYDDIIRSTQAEDVKKFLDFWKNRNLITYTKRDESMLRFNTPIKSFLDISANLSQLHLLEA